MALFGLILLVLKIGQLDFFCQIYSHNPLSSLSLTTQFRLSSHSTIIMNTPGECIYVGSDSSSVGSVDFLGTFFIDSQSDGSSGKDGTNVVRTKKFRHNRRELGGPRAFDVKPMPNRTKNGRRPNKFVNDEAMASDTSSGSDCSDSALTDIDGLIDKSEADRTIGQRLADIVKLADKSPSPLDEKAERRDELALKRAHNEVDQESEAKRARLWKPDDNAFGTGSDSDDLDQRPIADGDSETEYASDGADGANGADGDDGADIPDDPKFEDSNVPGLERFPVMRNLSVGHPLPEDLVAMLKERVNRLYLNDRHKVVSQSDYQQLYRQLWCIEYIKHRRMQVRK